MPQVDATVRFNSLRNLLVAELTVDSSTATTHGTAISIGVKSELTWSPQYVMEDLRSVRGIAESDRYVDFVNWSFKHGETNLNAWPLAFGGAPVLVPSGETTKSKVIYALEKGLKRKYLGLIGQPVTVAGGPADFYVCLLKCQVESFNPGRMGGGWAEFEMGGRAFYTIKDEVLFSVATLEQVTDVTFNVVLEDIATFLAG